MPGQVRAAPCLISVLATAVAAAGILAAPPAAAADCIKNADGVTVCGHGDVRGSQNFSPDIETGPVYPYPCEEDDWYCGDGVPGL